MSHPSLAGLVTQAAIADRDPRVLLDELAAIGVEIAVEVSALRIALATV
jgi:hypothetical protein